MTTETKVNTEMESSTTTETNTRPSLTQGFGRGFSTKDLGSVCESTLSTLHVIYPKKGKDPSSARVHIETPDPSVEEVDASLTTPNHVCCVIDISGSMSLPARSKDEDGNVVEDAGLSILDIVKFATLVIAQSLNDQDRLSIVTYSNDAHIALAPTHMTSDGKELVKATLSTINSFMRTNLFAGVKLGIELAHTVGSDFINSVFVLTDGFPNVHPELGYEASIAKELSNNPMFGAISTFGFGYQLDSKLLGDIAKIGGGYYSFIPDAGMVGTCFINALANSRCAFGINPVLKISGCDFKRLAKSKIIPSAYGARGAVKKLLSIAKHVENAIAQVVAGLTVDECLETSLHDDDIYIKLTPLRYGSSVDVMLKPALLKQKEDIKITLSFEMVGGKTHTMKVLNADANAADEVFHSKRAQFVKDAFNISFNPFKDSACGTFLNAAKEDAAENSNLDALYQDMKGQATEAIASEASLKTWGKHFLLSLSTAHLHQFCNNFKDPGVQVYGSGHLFSSLQDTLDDIFEKIPPPETTRQTNGTVQMSKVFNNRNAVCVHAKTIVAVKTSSCVISHIPICRIQKGDLVLTSNGTYAKVDCLVETVVDDETYQHPFELIKVGQLCVTPYHPVKLNEHSGWQFPIQISHSEGDQYVTTNTVYNLVLERGHRHKAVIMDGIEAITLGHGITDDATLQHSYFGTDKVVSDLEMLDGGIGWKAGHIILKENNVKRDSSSGHICHISGMKYGNFPCVPCRA